jgi:hypothetical protein
MLDDAMSEDGYVAPMTAVADAEIIDGSARLERAFDRFNDEAIILEHDGSKPIITVRTDIPNASTLEAKRIAIRANRIAEADLSWNPEVLSELVDTKALEGMFSDKELAEILSQTGVEPKDARVETEKAAECQQKWQVVAGEVFTIGRHVVMCGDCTSEVAIARLMSGRKADVVLSDPIYGQNQEGVTNDAPETFEHTIRGAVKALPISNGVVVAFQSPRTFTAWLDAVRVQGQRFERLLWLYEAAQCTFPWRGWSL